MIYIAINAPAILAAGLISVALALLWYRAWLPPSTMVTVLLASLWLAAILAGALILAPPKGSVWTMTIGSAVVIWAGFVAPALAASYRLRGLPTRQMLADCGFWLGSMVLQAMVMRVVGLVPPPIA
jgi:hypothetical protein